MAVGLLDLQILGSVWLLLAVAIADAVLGTALGPLVSAFAATDFQAVQFMLALAIPQILLCGLIVPRDQLPRMLGRISDVLPSSYTTDATNHVRLSTSTSEVWPDLAVVVGFAVAGLALGAATLRRRTP